MPNLYLKIVDIDRFEDTKVVDEKKATHVVEVDESEYADIVEMFNKYLPKIKSEPSRVFTLHPMLITK